MSSNIKLFLTTSHLKTLESNYCKDIRLRIIEDFKSSNRRYNSGIKLNDRVVYIGEYVDCYKILSLDDNYLNSIVKSFDLSDLIVMVFDCKFIIYDVLKLLYAVFSCKRVVIFISNGIVGYHNYYDYNYLLDLCILLRDGISIKYYDFHEEILEFISKVEKDKAKYDVLFYSPKRILSEVRIFVSSRFRCAPKDINDMNIEKSLKRDFRSKLFGSSEYLIFERDNLGILYNKSVKYMGSFYYYTDKNDSLSNRIVLDYKNAVKQSMGRIRNSNLVFILLESNDCIVNISDLIYASLLKKRVFLFYNKNTLKFNIDELLVLVKNLCSDIKVYDFIDYNVIIEMIRNANKYL